MKHPSEAELALLAGGDLSAWRRWRLRRHLSGCAACRAQAAAFDSDRQVLSDAVGYLPPEIGWPRLASEMKANIRLGLEAGECVGGEPAVERLGWRPAAALAGVAALVITGWWLNVPQPKPQAGVLLEATQEGIELRENGRGLALKNTSADRVTYTVNTRGAVRARYVDTETGQVTIHHVYVD